MLAPDDLRRPAARRLQQLAGRPESGLESGLATAPDLSPGRRRATHEAVARCLAANVVENPATPFGQDAADAVLADADHALEKLAAEGPEAELTPAEEMVMEAVIHADGSRPSLPVRDGFLDTADEKLGSWTQDVLACATEIRRAIAATGRLIRGDDLSDTAVHGTAWMIAPGIAATAMHVAEGLFVEQAGQWVPRFGPPVFLDFHVEAGAAPRPAERIAVTGLLKPSPDRIGNRLDLANLDAALLQLAEDGPRPLECFASLVPPTGAPRIHVVGHPVRLVGLAAGGDPAGATAMTASVVALVFGEGFGIKRWSPGEILAGPGALAGDVHGRVITHDASTLGGNSGSPVLDFVDLPDRVLALHYGGAFRRENYAHPTGLVRDFLETPQSVFA